MYANVFVLFQREFFKFEKIILFYLESYFETCSLKLANVITHVCTLALSVLSTDNIFSRQRP